MFRFSCRFRPCPGHALLRLGLLLSLAGSPRANSAAEPSVSPAPAPLRSVQAYWEITATDRPDGHPFQFEVDVTYSDPVWRHVWLQDEGAGAFFATNERTPTFTPGQRVRVIGRFPADGSLQLTGASAEVLGPARLAPLQMPATGWFDRPEPYNNLLVTLEAHVDRQVLADPEHLHLFLSADGRAFFAWLLIPPGQPAPDLTRTTVRLTGVFTILRTVDGQPGVIELKVQSPAQIEVLHRLSEDPRFNLPVSAMATLPQRPPDALVHVVGRVRGQQPSRSIILRDDTGQIEVLSGQSLPCQIGEHVEAIGYPEINGTTWRLRAALYRPHRVSGASTTARPTPGLPVLRLASAVLELPAAEALRAHPVELAGVVTWSHPDAPFFFLQDASGGVQIQAGNDKSPTYQPGRSVVVHGVSRLGDFAPVVVADLVRKTGDMPLPRAEAISLEHALTGRAEAQYIELRGLIRSVARETPWTRLELATAAGDFTALLPGADEPPALVGAAVRVRGVCTADTDRQRRIRGVRVWLNSTADIQVEEPTLPDIFALPLQPLAELGRFGSPQESDRRVHLAGTVLGQASGRWVQVQDGDISLRVLDRGGTVFRPGERIEAVGYLTRRGGRTVLREATCRAAGNGTLPTPLAFSGSTSEASELDGRLVTTSGRLLNVTTSGPETRVNVLAPSGIITAFIEFPLPPALVPNSQLALTGLVDVIYDEQGQATSFRLRPRDATDLVLLERPSWFTLERMLAITSALALVVGLALLWIVLLRRRVSQQTAQLREQLRREHQLEAELQRAARLESLGLLAGGIAHDFNNLLTVIVGHLSLATLDGPLEPEMAEHLQAASRASFRARDLTQQLLTFAKGGSPVRAALALPDLVREVTEFVLRGTAVSCQFEFAPELRPALVDRGQISQVVQNLVINALQAMPGGGRLRVALANRELPPGENRLLAPGSYLHLEIADTGTGIAPDVLPRIFDPYFTTKSTGTGIGLATVYSIVRKHGGHITVESTVGVGTTFHLLLPAGELVAGADETPTAEPTAALAGRVLLMDDEADIRRLATEMLRHLGLEVQTAADGEAAVAEYARALHAARAYDLVILDLTVPGGMGGLQALEALRRIDPQVRAIVSSGYSEDEILSNYRRHGFCAMVPKPYGLAEFAAALRPLLRHRTDS